MKIFEAMVLISKDDCPMCAPGTTFKGTHANIVHMCTPAVELEHAREYFRSQGKIMSNIHEVGTTTFKDHKE